MIRPAPRRQKPQEPASLPRQRKKPWEGGGPRTPLPPIVAPEPTSALPHLRDAAPRRREGPVQAAILRYLERLSGVIVWRMNSRVLMLPGKGGKLRPVRFGGVKGMADILGSVPWCYRCRGTAGSGNHSPWHGCSSRPRPFAFEVKSEGKPLSGDQEAFGAAVIAAGWLHARVESVEAVIKALGR